MLTFTPIASGVGGALIGLSASVLLVLDGRIAGISGIFGGVLVPKSGELGWRAWFMTGLVLTGILWSVVHPSSFGAANVQSVGLTVVAGLLVGFGTQVGSGCTSGHGVCGLSRLSLRSLAATLTFMATGAISVFVLRHIFGGG